MKVYVKTRELITDSYRSPEEWGEWSENYDFTVLGVCTTKPDQMAGFRDAGRYEEFTIGFEPKIGDTVCVLYMIYSSGDSFGNSDGQGEVFWVFPDGSSAIAAQRIIEKNIEQYTVEFDDGCGNKIQIQNPAAGYFERMTDIDVMTFILKDMI
jgi:hypothetical protein